MQTKNEGRDRTRVVLLYTKVAHRTSCEDVRPYWKVKRAGVGLALDEKVVRRVGDLSSQTPAVSQVEAQSMSFLPD